MNQGSTQLQTMVAESGLEQTKAQMILAQFTGYFQMAAEWEAKAKVIVVTSIDQKAEMKMARTGRLFLKEKRIAIEKTRKQLKEQALREGKAIDGISNVLKALIAPIEIYLGDQERFAEVERKRLADELQAEEDRKADAERFEAELAMEQERIEKEKAETEARIERERVAAEEQARIEKENQKLRDEARRREESDRRDREAAEAEKRRVDAEHEQELAAERHKAECERREAAERERAVREDAQSKADAERAERARLEEILKNTVKCPHCGESFVLGGGK